MKNRLLIFLFTTFLPFYMVAQKVVLDTYQFGEGLNFTNEDDTYQIKFSGFIQPSFETKKYTESEEENFYTRFRLRRLNLRLSGYAIKQKIEYRIQLNFSGTSETGDESNGILMDAWVAYSPVKNIQITFGQQRSPTDNRELMMGSHTLQLAERSKLTSAFAVIREFGLFVDGTFKAGNNSYLRPYFALTNGDGINVNGYDHGGVKLGGRLDFLPFGLFSNMGQFRQADVVRELTPKLVVGGYYSYSQGVSSRSGDESGAIIYYNSSSDESLPDYNKYGADFLFKYRGFSVIGEYVESTASVPNDITQRLRSDGTLATTFDVDGVEDVENYVKGRMILGRAYNIQMGYFFKNRISVDARYTYLEADTHSFLNNGTFYNRPKYYTLGLSKYLSKGYGFKIQSSLTYVELSPGSNDIFGNEITGNEWIFNMIISLAF